MPKMINKPKSKLSFFRIIPKMLVQHLTRENQKLSIVRKMMRDKDILLCDSHVFNLTKLMIQEKIIEKTKSGRDILIRLTPKGELIKEAFSVFDELKIK